MVFGGIHSTLFADEVREHGQAHAVVSGDGDLVWPHVLADCVGVAEAAARRWPYRRGNIHCGAMGPAADGSVQMWGSVQTVRGCPKHCSFCSVWRTDGQKPRQRAVDAVIREVVALRRKGFRFILLADDNFYPVTLEDLARRIAAPTRAVSTR